VQVRPGTQNDLNRRVGGKGSSTGKSGATTAVASDHRGFLDLLAEVLPASSPDKAGLQTLWAQMPDAERELLQNPAQENLTRYQELVRSIARQTLDQNVRVEKLFTKGRITKTEKELSTIRIIDERLQQMAILMQSKGNSAFGLLQKLAEIRGMLMDLKR